MKIFELTTPSFLVDLDMLTTNIKEMGDLCRTNNIQLWPMTKAHKSTTIAQMQYAAGVGGFLTGTLDEAESLVNKGYKDIMLAYPVAGKKNLARVIELARLANVLASLDGREAAEELQLVLDEANLNLDYLLLIDCGLHRFGVQPQRAKDLLKDLQRYPRLNFRGIATHPGQVYAATNRLEVDRVAQEEAGALHLAVKILREEGFKVEIVASGSTPTAKSMAKAEVLTVLRPGNYVFYDNIQRNMGIIEEERCALTVLATVISRPREDLLIIDAGSKCFGLDKGAHGISTLQGFGLVKGHKELIVSDLSEEVAKIRIEGATRVKVGDKLRIIPNHACSAINMTNYLIGHRGENLDKIIEIDSRGGSRKVKW